ncbi:hypothetical protein DM791_05145 [Paenarthrobacter nitroguajacolicus]|nr:hypothetical protein [Paenarthrobacter nitroguajacolicus]
MKLSVSNALKLRISSIAGSAVLILGLGIAVPAPADAYAFTGCKWASSSMTYKNDAVSGYTDPLIDAGYSWASASDIDGMHPTGGAMRAYVINNGANGYDGYSKWNCPFGNLWSSEVTLNTYYAQGYTYWQKRVVWVHELGHGMGLDHSSWGTVMYTCPRCTYDSFGTYWPTNDDQAGANALY